MKSACYHFVVSVAAVLWVRVTDNCSGPVRVRDGQVAVEGDVIRGGELHGSRRHNATVPSAPMASPTSSVDDKLPIKMLNDRVLVKISDIGTDRKSSGGIVIPATAQVQKRLVWATVVAQGQNVRSCEIGDKVLFSPDDRYEVEVQGEDYVMLRERELHAVAAERIEASTGLYL